MFLIRLYKSSKIRYGDYRYGKIKMDECGSYSRDSNLDKFVERIYFVDKVDFANKTLNQAGKQAGI
jgi:hypothetical protein